MMKRAVSATALVLLLSVSAVASWENQYSCTPGIGSPWVNPKDHTDTRPATKGGVFQVGDIIKGTSEWPADKKFYIPPWWEVELYCTRASTDWDTKKHLGDDGRLVNEPVTNALHPQWPRFQCNFGQFLAPEYDRGTHVVWRAPESTTNDGVGITLFEQDVPFPISIPPDDGTVDDGGPNNGEGSYNNQDRIWFVTRPIEVSLTVRNGDTETTSTNPGPNSRNKLGLWWTNEANRVPEKNPWSMATTEGPPDGSIVNGTSVFLVDEVNPLNSHPYATGSVLKTEIYATIHMMLLLPDRIYQEARKPENWAIRQQRRHGLSFGENAPYTHSTNPNEYTDGWVDDGAVRHPHTQIRAFSLTLRLRQIEDGCTSATRPDSGNIQMLRTLERRSSIFFRI